MTPMNDDEKRNEADIQRSLTIINRLTQPGFGPWYYARKRLQWMIFWPVLKVMLIAWLLWSLTSCVLVQCTLDQIKYGY